jgi:hypothetical protein
VSTSPPIELSSGLVTKADRLIITLVQPPDTLEAILIIWPLKPTVVEPARLQATVAAIVKVLSTPISSTPRDAYAVPTPSICCAETLSVPIAPHSSPQRGTGSGPRVRDGTPRRPRRRRTRGPTGRASVRPPHRLPPTCRHRG